MLKRLILCAALISSPAFAKEPYPLSQRNKADIIRQVKDILLDGESARWRWPLHQPDFGVYCGWVNSKNKMGAYTGWTPYVVIGGAGSDNFFRVTTFDFHPAIVQEMCVSNGYDINRPPPE